MRTTLCQPGETAPARLVPQLRDMVEGDLGEVMRVEREAFEYPWSEAMLRGEFMHEWAHIVVAEIDDAPATSDAKHANLNTSNTTSGLKCAENNSEHPTCRLVGFIVFWLIAGELHVLNVAVAPLAQRRGVGRALMDEAFRRARDANVTEATLEVRRSNLAAIRLYESFGFATTAIRRGYYEENGEDALVMGRTL